MVEPVIQVKAVRDDHVVSCAIAAGAEADYHRRQALTPHEQL